MLFAQTSEGVQSGSCFRNELGSRRFPRSSCPGRVITLWTLLRQVTRCALWDKGQRCEGQGEAQHQSQTFTTSVFAGMDPAIPPCLEQSHRPTYCQATSPNWARESQRSCRVPLVAGAMPLRRAPVLLLFEMLCCWHAEGRTLGLSVGDEVARGGWRTKFWSSGLVVPLSASRPGFEPETPSWRRPVTSPASVQTQRST